ncbi:hypothetical protein ABZX40_33270 [Streptomyces sp. NPDC004610]|uniref:hypothetical protein n=1 Tax=unclassified Streptomyces TaxID=2593676 RepID=UPI0033A80BDE
MEEGGPAAADLRTLLDLFADLAGAVAGGADPRFSEFPVLIGTRVFPHEGLARVDGSWVDPGVIEELLTALPGVREASVSMSEGEGFLSARVVADGPLSPDGIRRELLELFALYPSGVVPARIRVEPESAVRVGGPFPSSPAEKALAEVLGAAGNSGPVRIDGEESYLGLGGSLTAIPGIVAALAARGRRGLGPGGFAGHRSLRMLARRMCRVSG